MRNKRNAIDASDNLLLGLKLGYPQCCIDNFTKETRSLPAILERPRRKLNGTGFIPCQHCSDNYTEDELVETINKNRSLDMVSFPNY